jgi:Fe2+ or Zn2+ uptake regulation protein
MTHNTSDYGERIRAQGFRLTPQRQMILDAICELGGHVTPEAIYDRVRAKSPAVNRATVYRNLDFLCEMRLVVAAHIGRQTRYEIAGEQPHHHLICRACDAVVQLDNDAVAAFFDQVERRQRFLVDMDHLTLFGLCPGCRPAAAETPARRAR